MNELKQDSKFQIFKKPTTDRYADFTIVLGMVDIELNVMTTISPTYFFPGTTWMQNVADIIVHKGDVERLTRDKERTTVIDVHLEQRNVESAHGVPHVSKSHHMANVYHKQLEEDRANFIVVVRNPLSFLPHKHATGPFPGHLGRVL